MTKVYTRDTYPSSSFFSRLLLCVFALAPSLRGGEAHFQSCYARWSDAELTLGNALVERKWRIKNGHLTATSFRDLAANMEWIAKPADQPAPRPAKAPAGKYGKKIEISAAPGRLSPVEEEALMVHVTGQGTRLCLRLFPEASGVEMRFEAGGDTPAPASMGKGSAPATGIEEERAAPPAVEPGDALEDLLLAPQHLRFTQVTLLDQTDVRNELVFENEWLLMPNEAPLKLPGNVFFVENPLTRAGLVFVKLAPLPHARALRSEWDALVQANTRRVRFAGPGYPFALLAYRGGRPGRIETLQRYQRQLRAYNPQRDGMFLSNTWGDRSRDARINEPFILQEIAAGSRLGVDVVQIDDGWQKGRTANSAVTKGAWNGYWAVDPDFWKPDAQRFPAGLGPVVSAARAKGMHFGLWYGPDSSNDIANWERDADRILELHRTEGIDYFKLDSVKVQTPAGEANLHRLFDRVLQESQGRVVIDLDVTAEIRPGYFGAPNVGPIFVENRYTDFHRYWPHQTLRNLWKLSQYVDPLRLRMEFLNNTRHVEKYGGDPLAPACYQPDSLFAIVMMANPLGWFETSNLPEAYRVAVAKLVAVWKRERPSLLAGCTIPVGDPPDGVSWTGFVSVGADRRHGYALVFREASEQAEWSVDLPLFAGDEYRVVPLAGDGEASLAGHTLSVRIPQTLRYIWLRIEPS